MDQPINSAEDNNLSPEVAPLAKKFKGWQITIGSIVGFVVAATIVLELADPRNLHVGSVSDLFTIPSLAIFLFFLLFLLMLWKLARKAYKEGKPKPPEQLALPQAGQPTQPEKKEEKKTSSGKKFPWARAMKWAVFIALFIAAFNYFPIYLPYVRSVMGVPPPIVHRNFRPRQICPVTKTYDYSHKKLDQPLVITLTEGCYGDWYILPADSRFEANKTTGSDDYISMWCNGHTSPEPTVEYYTEGMGGELRNGCAAPGEATNHFRFQGHGTITFFPITDGS